MTRLTAFLSVLTVSLLPVSVSLAGDPSFTATIQLDAPDGRPFAPDTLIPGTVSVSTSDADAPDSVSVTLSGRDLHFLSGRAEESHGDAISLEIDLEAGTGSASFEAVTPAADVLSPLAVTIRSLNVNLDDGTLLARTPVGLKHCARAYHESLFSQSEELLKVLDDATKVAKSRDGFLNKNRLFSHRKVRRTSETVRAIGAANALQGRRLKDRYLTGNEGAWYLNSFRRDLNQYLDQDLNPGLCSGAQFMVEYLTPLTRTIRERADDLEVYAVDAREALNDWLAALEDAVAAETLADGITVAEAQGDGGAGILIRGAVPIGERPERPEVRSYQDLLKAARWVMKMIRYPAQPDASGNNTETAEETPEEEEEVPEIFAALQELRGLVRGEDALVNETPHAGLYREAAALIETAFLTGRAEKKVADVEGAIFGAFETIVRINREECTCIE